MDTTEDRSRGADPYAPLEQLEGVTRLAAGKVRELFTVGSDELLLVATDRVSAYDVVLPTPIPGRGEILTALSDFWFTQFADLVPTHRLSIDASRYPAGLAGHADLLAGRSMLCRRADMLGVECVARGYLAGSGYTDYQATGAVCGVTLPAGLREAEALPEPIFTPATKATSGHDENITFEQAAAIVGVDTATRLRELTLALYARAHDHAWQRGIILADTKFEFGIIDGELVLCDEACTPDSSRYWPADGYEPGRRQPSFDKQIVRDWLADSGWDKTPPAPALPDDVVDRTRERYQEVLDRLTAPPTS